MKIFSNHTIKKISLSLLYILLASRLFCMSEFSMDSIYNSLSTGQFESVIEVIKSSDKKLELQNDVKFVRELNNLERIIKSNIVEKPSKQYDELVMNVNDLTQIAKLYEVIDLDQKANSLFDFVFNILKNNFRITENKNLNLVKKYILNEHEFESEKEYLSFLMDSIHHTNAKYLGGTEYENLYSTYYEYYTFNNEILNAQLYQELYKNKKQSILNSLINNKINKIRTSHTSYKLIQEKNRLNELRRYKIQNIGIVGIILFLSMMFYYIIYNYKISIVKKQLENQTIELEQSILQEQMNPHFIFNALTAIHSHVLRGKSVQAVEYLEMLSKLLFQVFSNAYKKFVSIDSELDTLHSYFKLQQLRFFNKFNYSIEVDPAINSSIMCIPPMMIQPFVENAIEHGISGLDKKGLITVKMEISNDLLQCKIVDNGKGYYPEFKSINATKNSLSQKITSERINILNQQLNTKGKFEINNIEESTGTIVTLAIPIKRIV